MKRLIVLLLAIPLLLVIAATITLASNGRLAANKNLVKVSSEEVIEEDYFAAAERVEISGTLNGDVYTAGGEVIVDGTVNGDLLAAGGIIRITGKISQDVRIAGGQIIITGEIDGNVTMVGGSLELTSSAKINGSLVGAGGNININAPIGGGANLAGGNLVVSNKVDGNVKAAFGTIRLASEAEITGNFTYWSEEEASIDEEVKIAGETTHHLPPEAPKPPARKFFGALAGFLLFAKVTSFISSLIIGLLLIRLFPRCSQQTADTIRKRPLGSLGIGFLSIIIFPIIFVTLLIALVTIPLAFIFLGTFMIVMYLVKIYVFIFVGEVILRSLGKNVNLNWALLCGLITIQIINLLPIVGGLVTLLVPIVGLGAAVLSSKNLYRTAREKDVI